MLNRCPTHTDRGLWMRPVYREGFHRFTAVVRRRDRSNPTDVTFIPLNEDMPVRFLEQMGRRDADIQPRLFSDDGTTVQVVERIVKKISDLTISDLMGGTPDIATPKLVRYHLALIDNTSLPDWDEVVTIYRLKHMPKAVDPNT